MSEILDGDIRDGFDDVAVGEPRSACLVEADHAPIPALHPDVLREFEDGLGPLVARAGLPGLGHLLSGQPDPGADERMGAEAIGALIGFSHGQSDLLAELRGKFPAREGGAEAEVAAGDRGPHVPRHPKQVRDRALLGLHIVEERHGRAGSGRRIEMFHAFHASLPGESRYSTRPAYEATSESRGLPARSAAQAIDMPVWARSRKTMRVCEDS